MFGDLIRIEEDHKTRHQEDHDNYDLMIFLADMEDEISVVLEDYDD